MHAIETSQTVGTGAGTDPVRTAAWNWPQGFATATASAAINKAGRDDLALLAMPAGATAAAVFTRNLFAAAPIEVSRRHLKDSHGHASALLLNSGCANAATGPRGLANAVESVDLVARLLGCAGEAVLVNSTGVIGVQLPMDRIAPEIPRMVAALADAADAGPLGTRTTSRTSNAPPTAFSVSVTTPRAPNETPSMARIKEPLGVEPVTRR